MKDSIYIHPRSQILRNKRDLLFVNVQSDRCKWEGSRLQKAGWMAAWFNSVIHAANLGASAKECKHFCMIITTVGDLVPSTEDDDNQKAMTMAIFELKTLPWLLQSDLLPSICKQSMIHFPIELVQLTILIHKKDFETS